MSVSTRTTCRVLAFTAICALGVAAPVRAACNVGSTASVSFGSITSFVVRSTVQQSSTTNSGITCSGAVLSIGQSGDHFYATVSSAHGGLRGPGGALLSYSPFATSSTSFPVSWGVQFDYVTAGSALAALGLFGGPAVSLPMYFRTSTGANLAAGVYTDTVTVSWSWDYCSGIGLFGICLGRDTGSGSSSFDVTITVLNACQISAAPDVGFGDAPTVGSFITVTQGVSVLCTKDLSSFSVGLNGGQHASGGRRRMQSGANYLQYDLFKVGTSQVWGGVGGDRSSSSSPANGNTAQTLQYRAQIYTDQATPALGHYVDTIVIDVTF